MSEYVLALLVAATVSYVLTPLVRRFAIRVGAMTQVRDRDVHVVPIPRLGGLAMFVGLAVGLLVAEHLPGLSSAFDGTHMIASLLLAGGLMVLIGAIDDRWGMNWISKLAAQVAAGAILVANHTEIDWLPLPRGHILAPTPNQSMLLTILFVVATVNAVNFIDGLDGLAAGIVVIAAVSFFLYYHSLTIKIHLPGGASPALASAVLAGVCLGFLPHNFHPARIFMGDSGSYLLGLVLAYAPIAAISSIPSTSLTDTFAYHAGAFNRFAVILPLLLPAAILVIPYGDMALAVVRRTRAGMSPFAPDRKHLHHRLLDIGHSHRSSVLIMYLWAILFSGTVVFLSIVKTQLFVFGVITAAAMLVLLLMSMPRLRWWQHRDRPPGPPGPTAGRPGSAGRRRAGQAVPRGQPVPARQPVPAGQPVADGQPVPGGQPVADDRSQPADRPRPHGHRAVNSGAEATAADAVPDDTAARGAIAAPAVQPGWQRIRVSPEPAGAAPLVTTPAAEPVGESPAGPTASDGPWTYGGRDGAAAGDPAVAAGPAVAESEGPAVTEADEPGNGSGQSASRASRSVVGTPPPGLEDPVWTAAPSGTASRAADAPGVESLPPRAAAADRSAAEPLPIVGAAGDEPAAGRLPRRRSAGRPAAHSPAAEPLPRGGLPTRPAATRPAADPLPWRGAATDLPAAEPLPKRERAVGAAAASDSVWQPETPAAAGSQLPRRVPAAPVGSPGGLLPRRQPGWPASQPPTRAQTESAARPLTRRVRPDWRRSGPGAGTTGTGTTGSWPAGAGAVGAGTSGRRPAQPWQPPQAPETPPPSQPASGGFDVWSKSTPDPAQEPSGARPRDSGGDAG